MSSFALEIRDATRTARKARIGFFGPSSSGKTYTSFVIARALAGDKPFVLIDAEAGRGELYADFPEFKPYKVISVKAPFSPEHYIAAIRFAERSVQELDLAPVCVLDTISHEWSGEGGVQTIVDEATARQGGNKWAAWAIATPRHNRFVETVLQSPLHMIVTMRSKTEWKLDEKNRPQKIGLAPVQREELEYELDLVFRMDMTHTAEVVKTFLDAVPLGLMIEEPDQKLAEPIADWLQKGIDPGDRPGPLATGGPPAGEQQRMDENGDGAAAAGDDGGEKAKAATKGAITRMINELDSAHEDYEGLTWEDDTPGAEGERGPVKHDWKVLADVRAQEWFGAAYGDLTEKDAQTMLERLRFTKEKLDEQKAAAGPTTL